MLQRLKDDLLKWIKEVDTKSLILDLVLFVAASLFMGTLLRYLFENITSAVLNDGWHFRAALLLEWQTWALGGFVSLLLLTLYAINGGFRVGAGRKGRGLLGGSASKNTMEESPLENSRFLTDAERDKYFPKFTYETLPDMKNDGVPARAVLNRKGVLEGNFKSGVHALVIGATGSGKTTTFINPMIQLIAATNCGSSMIMTDPKGELFDLHSKFLKDRGYNVMVLDLRDTYSSSRWNPLEPIWDAYQEYLHAGSGIIAHLDPMSDYPDLRRMNGEGEDGAPWVEWNGCAYLDMDHCKSDIEVSRNKIYDEMYEDLQDLVGGLVPITNEKDQMWERGARSLVTAVCLAMLEDSGDPSLGMTKEKFNLFNVNKALSNSDSNYKVLKEYFEGRSALSQAFQLSRQVLSAPEQTMSSYMSVTLDKLTIFNDRGICGLTSATDIRPDRFAFEKSALFLKIPDEKDTRHSLASLFILSTYKALIKIATGLPGQTLPRNVYYIMDEFGNMPKIDKFGQMITVGRSRKIWFSMVVQSFVQLTNVYGKEVADIVIGNCGVKMFIGSNDTDTCKMFSEMCGNMTVRTTSTSSSLGSKAGDINVSSQTQVRPLIYPSELQRLNNQESTGNSIIVSFNSYPLKTKYTPSYKCPFYKFGPMDLTEIRSNVFRADEVFYDLKLRNSMVLGNERSS
ncbi:MAG: type IV secretory system conjugative DNA transfer family protein [Oscillospiraceae bacterium]|nr:type IV secretory system conjugative DNA transfer family protein [Oscillospiraceae bacterium]